MFDINEISIIISGWLGSGSTITSIILAFLLEKKLICVGEVSKFIAKKMGYETTNNELLEYEKEFGRNFDFLWEKYINYKLKNKKNLIINSKISGFFINNISWFFSVFLISAIQERQYRIHQDGRKENIIYREKELQKRWKKKFKFDFKNIEQLNDNYDFVLDNSNLTISQTIFRIYQAMKPALGLREVILFSNIQKIEKLISIHSKKTLVKKLKEKKLYVTPYEIIKDWKINLKKELKKVQYEYQNTIKKI